MSKNDWNAVEIILKNKQHVFFLVRSRNINTLRPNILKHFPSQVLPSFHKATISCTCVGTNGIGPMDPDVWNASFNLRFQTSANFQLSHCQNVPNEFLRHNVGYITLSSYHLYCLLAGHLKKRSFLPHFFRRKGSTKNHPPENKCPGHQRSSGKVGKWNQMTKMTRTRISKIQWWGVCGIFLEGVHFITFFLVANEVHIDPAPPRPKYTTSTWQFSNIELQIVVCNIYLLSARSS